MKPNPMTQSLIVDFKIHPAHASAFSAAIAHNARLSIEREPGCRQFDVCRDPVDPTAFFLYELYDDEAAVTAHLNAVHFLEFDALTRDWVEHKQVRRYLRTHP